MNAFKRDKKEEEDGKYNYIIHLTHYRLKYTFEFLFNLYLLHP